MNTVLFFEDCIYQVIKGIAIFIAIIGWWAMLVYIYKRIFYKEVK